MDRSGEGRGKASVMSSQASYSTWRDFGAAVGPLSAPWLFLNVPQGRFTQRWPPGWQWPPGMSGGAGLNGRMQESKESLRRQLLAARQNVQAQIDTLRGLPSPLPGSAARPSAARPRSNDALIARLTETLADLEDILAELGDGS
jgi:hypothetical protein